MCQILTQVFDCSFEYLMCLILLYALAAISLNCYALSLCCKLPSELLYLELQCIALAAH